MYGRTFKYHHYVYRGHMFSIFSSNSEAFASELLEMFPRYIYVIVSGSR